MRARNIKPGFFTNEDLAECTFPARILFIGLWCLADREGRLQDRPKKIKMEVFPADDVDVDTALGELAQYGLIRRYQVEDASYIDIPAFLKHQRCHANEQPSSIPPFPEALATKVTSTCNQGDKHLQPKEQPLRPSLLNPSRLNSRTPSSPPTPVCTKDEVLPPESDTPPAPLKGGVRTHYSKEFLRFWESYPKRKGKDAAWKAWGKRNGDRPSIDIIVTAIRNQRASPEWQKESGQYIPLPATWINQGRWADEMEVQPVARSPAQPPYVQPEQREEEDPAVVEERRKKQLEAVRRLAAGVFHSVEDAT